MIEKDNLRTALERLRRDDQLRNAVSEIGELVRRERALTPPESFETTYKSIIIRSLHHLAETHLRNYYESSSGDSINSNDPCLILLSYQSSVIGATERKRRVTDWHPDLLSGETRYDGLSDHVKSVINQAWLKKASLRPNAIELHLLAQKRISLAGSVAIRPPIYLSAGTPRPSWLRQGVPLGNTLIILRDEEESTGDNAPAPVAVYVEIPFAKLETKEIALELSEFVSEVKTVQANKRTPYPGHTVLVEDYEAYGDYLKALLVYPDQSGATPMCLCTIAVSDELSNVPLGTAMIISPWALDYSIAAGISHICFDLFSAYYKIEQEASLLRETAFLITAWVHHETAHWSNYVDSQAYDIDEIIDHVNTYVGDKVQLNNQPSKPSLDFRALSERLTEVSKELEAISATATLSTELLKQLGGTSSALIPVEEFCDKVSVFLRLYSHIQATVEPDAQKDVPRALLLTCCEFIRNADKHLADKGAVTGKIHISLGDRAGFPELRVLSEPHDVKRINGLDALNKVRNSGTPDLHEVLSKKEHLGGLLVHMMAKVMGGFAEWTWEPINKTRIRVQARCSLNATESEV
jgi:hypothetical protein